METDKKDTKCIIISQEEYDGLKQRINDLEKERKFSGSITVYTELRTAETIYVGVRQDSYTNLKMSEGSLTKIRTILQRVGDKTYKEGVKWGLDHPSQNILNLERYKAIDKFTEYLSHHSIWELILLKRLMKYKRKNSIYPDVRSFVEELLWK